MDADTKEILHVRRRNIALVLLGVFVSVMLGLYFAGAFRFVYSMQRVITQKQQQLLYYIDHAALAKEMRNFAEQQKMQFPVDESAPRVFSDDNPEFPSSLKILECTSVAIFPDRIQLEFGGPLLHFGINIFNEGIRGHGNKELLNGVWFYSENGRVPGP